MAGTSAGARKAARSKHQQGSRAKGKKTKER